MTQTNEHGKVLIENWVEERACEAYDNDAHGPEVNRSGHVGIISTKEPETLESLSTTVRDTFRPPSRPNIRQKGMCMFVMTLGQHLIFPDLLIYYFNISAGVSTTINDFC